MASPSAPTCVVTATRSRVFRNSAISWTVLFFVRVVNRSYLPQSVLYPGYLFHDRVGLEAEFGRALEARLAPYGGLNAPGRAVQAFLGRLGILSGQDAVKDRACARSGLTRTPVTVTSPCIRGSESAATSSPVISFSCDSTLRVRPLIAIAPS